MVYNVITYITTSSAATIHTIKNLDPGLYIEQMGNATLDRGTFRIETTYERSILNYNLAKAKDVLKQFKTFFVTILLQ